MAIGNEDPPTLTPPPSTESGAAPSSWILRTRTEGIDRLMSRAALSVSELVQLAPGRLSAQLFRLTAPGTDVDGGQTSLPLRAVGTTSPGKVTVTFVLACPGRCVMDGSEIGPDTAIVWRPGVAYDGISPAGYRWATAILPERDVYDLVPQEAPAPDGRVPLRIAPLPRAIRTRATGLLETQRAWEAPGREPLDREAAAGLCRGWGDLVQWALRSASPVTPRTGALNAAAIVTGAERAFLARLASDIYVEDVCAKLGVATRTFEAAFKHVLGLRPMHYVEILRAHAVFRELRRTDARTPASVRDVELRCGVRHGARFAARYRAIFGENPTQTLRASRQIERAAARPPGADA